MKGTIKFFDRKQQYGFIVCDDMNQDIYFKMEDILNVRLIKPGIDVAFDYESLEGDRFRAYDIHPISDEVIAKAATANAVGEGVSVQQCVAMAVTSALITFVVGLVVGFAAHQLI
ncbi:cold-shock protein [Piscirickettsia salmonis]|uniref:cold-shock protein n=1 Tax=Piscirickettsia salmonis TaxID=1238 RepID=UPI0007C87D4E|nr:Cold-shock DNA-binding domain protein [Piscirickettsiaceae bacterium NZ-RLO1]